VSRRKFREDKSKFYGSKQVIQDLNQAAHATVHDLDPSVASVGVYKKFTQDLGAGNSTGIFDITGLSGLLAGKVVNIIQTAEAIASKGNARDEIAMDQIILAGTVVDSATIRVYWRATCVVTGIYAFAYIVSN
jgi:hypothetical protein